MATPTPDATPGFWLRDGLDPEGNTVAGFVPAGYPFYARILNPVGVEGFGSEPRRLAWSEAAASVGAPVYPWMQWHETVLAAGGALPREWTSPAMGDLDQVRARALAEVLEQHTRTANECFFAQWDGYAPVAGNNALVKFPLDREMKILAGPLSDGAQPTGGPGSSGYYDTPGSSGMEHPSSAHGGRRPLYWWPQDRAWCMGQDIYARSVLLGVSGPCLKDLFAHPDLDIFSVRLSDAVYPEDD
ncbi:hypothetical protein [Arthrobacter psychrochitiniphilus]|uniref:hypothetical protein n=1 Tax=Arthrobacter psychrochitiniphilus TaxID=291045 RepID=UPI003F7B677B